MASMSIDSSERKAAPAGTGGDWYLRQSALINRCNLTPWAIASQEFQEQPRPLEIAWIRQENQAFFDLLATLVDPAERALCFHDYVLSRFWLHEDRACWPSEKARLRASYVAVLRGWGIDSNGASGAVLKGWAEHRFGLRPIWHRTVLSTNDEARECYAAERMRGAMSGIGMQLDLLYTFCQEELRRRHPTKQWLTLFRGTHDPEAYEVKDSAGSNGLIEFNTVSSFADDPEVAWEFGSRVWEVRVPLAKIVYFTGLIPTGLLQGEAEHIVLGGDYRVRALSH